MTTHQDKVIERLIIAPDDPETEVIPQHVRNSIRQTAKNRGLWKRFHECRESKKRQLMAESGKTSIQAGRIGHWYAYATVFPQGITQALVETKADKVPKAPKKKCNAARADPGIDGERADVDQPANSYEGLLSLIPADRKASVIDQVRFAQDNAFAHWPEIAANPDRIPSRGALLFLRLAREERTDFVKTTLAKVLLTEDQLAEDRKRAKDADVGVLDDLDEQEQALLEQREKEAGISDVR